MIGNLLRQRADIHARSSAVGPMGEAIDTYTLAQSGVRCYSEHFENKFDAEFGRIGATATHIAWFQLTTHIDTEDRVVLDGDTYQVVHVDSKVNARFGKYRFTEAWLRILESPQASKANI